MAETILNLAMVLIAFSILFGVIRLIKGDTDTDRIIAVDLLTIVSLSILVLVAHLTDRFIYIDVAIVYGLLSFLGVLAVARYLERGL
ncbi:MAG: monovalent cation/H+ antiporter complex subunit F [Gammaproteobacteria bacterium]|nr:monovalent cation/H+ antiporter complex subunit F [Gammaproteobacteria bacterium]